MKPYRYGTRKRTSTGPDDLICSCYAAKMKDRTYPPELLRHRIVKVKSQLRWLQTELRKAEAEDRDRERMNRKGKHGTKDGAESRNSGDRA
jgi:hypothetical protein